MCLSGQNHPTVDDEENSSGVKDKPPDFDKIYKFVRDRLDKVSEREQRYYNLRRRDVRYRLGQKVWRKNYSHSDAANYFTNKLAAKYVGPLIIQEVVSPWTYKLADLQGKFVGVWHAKDLKEFHTDIAPDTTLT